jgi:hypothetical protein
MADDKSSKPSSAYSVYKNEEFNLKEYQSLAVYTLIFNAIANSPAEYGLPASNADVAIDNFIRTYLEVPIPNIGKSILDIMKGNGTNLDNVIHKEYFKGEKFEKIIKYAKKFAEEKPGNYSNGFLSNRLTNQDVVDILAAKRDDVREYFKNQLKATKGKPFNLDGDGKGESKNGVLYRNYENAINQLRMLKKERRYKGRELLKSVLGVAVSAAVGIGSLALVFTSGGAALGVLAGTSYATASLGAAGVGVIGSIISGKFFVKFFGDMKERFIKWRQQRRVIKEFKRGEGAFKSEFKDGQMKVRGLKQIEREYMQAKALNEWFKKGGDKKKIAREFRKWLRPALRAAGIGLNGKKYMKDQLEEFKFCSDDKDPNGFKVIENLLTKQKSLNVTDVTSVASWQSIFKDPKNLTHVKKVDPSGAETYEAKSIDELVNQYQVLKGYESEFAKNAETKADYENALKNMDAALMKAINAELFEKPYSASSLEHIKNIVENSPIVKERLSGSSYFGDLSKQIKNYINFISFESNSQFEALDENPSVSVENQMYMTKDNILDGVKNFGTAVDPTIEAIASTIGNSSSRTDLSALSAQIASVSDEKSRQYLEFMRDKKLNSTKFTQTDILSSVGTVTDATLATKVDEIARDIANIQESEVMKNGTESMMTITGSPLSSKGKIGEIRRKILGISDSNAEVRDSLMKSLDQQYLALENSSRIKIKANALKMVRQNSEPDLSELLEKIKNIKIDDVKEANDLYDQEISKIDNKQIKDYLTMSLGEKMCEKLGTLIADNTTKAAGLSIKEVIEIVSKVTNNRFMTEYQKEYLVHKLEPIIEKVTLIEFSKFEKLYMSLDDEKIKIIQDFTKEYAKGGMKQYMEMGTAQGIALRERIERLQNNLNDRDLFTLNVSSGSGVSGFTDMKEKEINKMSKMYFNRPFNDKSIDIVASNLRDIKSIASKIPQNEIDANPNHFDTSAGIAHTILARLDSITSDTATNNNDKMLYLLQLKRTAMLVFKAHAFNFLQLNGLPRTGEDLEVSFRTTIAGHTDSVGNEWDAIRNKWTTIATKIDEKIETTKIALETEATAHVPDGDEEAKRKQQIAKDAIKVYTSEGTRNAFVDYIGEFGVNNIVNAKKANGVLVKASGAAMTA